jgi:hypothetical protein
MLSSGVVAGIGAPAATSTMDEEAKLRKMKLMRYSELCIIPGKRYIEEPPIEELSMSVVEWCIEPNNADSYIFKE